MKTTGALGVAAALACLWSITSPGQARSERDVEPHVEGAPLRVETFSARAYAPDGRQRLYTERHRVELRGGRPVTETVTYHAAGGRVFAKKTLRYDRSLTAPSFRFEDLRSGRVESVTRRGARFLVALREQRGEPMERELLEPGARVVVDEGYRMLLRAQLPRLSRGHEVVSAAIVPSRLASYDMRFRGRGHVARRGARLLRVHLDMDDFLLRLVGPSADLYFDPASRRLVEFVGLANIRDAGDDLQQARILYRY